MATTVTLAAGADQAITAVNTATAGSASLTNMSATFHIYVSVFDSTGKMVDQRKLTAGSAVTTIPFPAGASFKAYACGAGVKMRVA